MSQPPPASADESAIITGGAHTAEDVEQLLELTRAAFAYKTWLPHDFFRHAWAAEIDDIPEQHRFCKVGDEFVSALRVAPRTCNVGAASFKVGCIGDVSTHPSHQRRGYASRCLADAKMYMAETGCLVSVLFANLVMCKVYEKSHYHSFTISTSAVCVYSRSESGGITCAPTELPAGVSIVDFDPSDNSVVDAFGGVYDAFHRSRASAGFLHRSRRYLVGSLRWCYTPRLFFALCAGDRIVAYVRASCTRAADVPSIVVNVHEVCWLPSVTPEEVMTALLSVLVQRVVQCASDVGLAMSTVGDVQFALYSRAPPELTRALSDVGTWLFPGTRTSFRSANFPGYMQLALLVHPARLLAAMLPELTRRVSAARYDSKHGDAPFAVDFEVSPAANPRSPLRARLMYHGSGRLDVVDMDAESVVSGETSPMLVLSEATSLPEIGTVHLELALLEKEFLALLLGFEGCFTSALTSAFLPPSHVEVLDALRATSSFEWNAIDKF